MYCLDDQVDVNVGTFGSSRVVLDLGQPVNLDGILGHTGLDLFGRFLQGAADVLYRTGQVSNLVLGAIPDFLRFFLTERPCPSVHRDVRGVGRGRTSDVHRANIKRAGLLHYLSGISALEPADILVRFCL